MSEMEKLRFPCTGLPADAGVQRLLGLYPMREKGLFMQRVKVPGGRISSGQLGALAGVAISCGPGFPLHLTTRQDIEIHGLEADDVPAAQGQIAAVGLTGLGACGDTLRNITVCPGSGFCPGSLEVSGLADALKSAAESLAWIREMPRKFKIGVSGCEKACARPWLNDVGLIATADGTFRAVLGGSLGARPGTGIAYGDTLAVGEVVPFVVAALRVFNREADRKNRSRARLRHVRERLGDEAFLAEIGQLFAAECRGGVAVELEALKAAGKEFSQTRLGPPLGDLEPSQAVAVARAAEAAGAAIRIGLEHDLFFFSERPVVFGEGLSRFVDNRRVVSCPGSAWCSRGIADSRRVADRIRGAYDGDLSIAISGCPNNCSHAAVADIGLIGRVRNVNGKPKEFFRLLAGGDRGEGPRLAEEIYRAVPAEVVPEVVVLLAERLKGREGGVGDCGDFVRGSAQELSEAVSERLVKRTDKTPPASFE